MEFIGPWSKMYSYVKDDEKSGKKAKSIKKNVIKNYIKHEDYHSSASWTSATSITRSSLEHFVGRATGLHSILQFFRVSLGLIGRQK